MKKKMFLLLGLIAVATVQAESTKQPIRVNEINYRYNEAISFMERGIEFHVFLNGDFDFNTRTRNRYYEDSGVRIERDYDGRIRRVGSVFINYDYRGNVKRIGSVFMRYKFGQLHRVGDLKIKYNKWGEPRYKGYVKSRKYKRCDDDDDYDDDDYDDYDDYDDDCKIGIDINIDWEIFDYGNVFFYQRDFINNYKRYKEDDNFYYYRANPNSQIDRRNRIIKRRKKTDNRFLKPEQRGKSRRRI